MSLMFGNSITAQSRQPMNNPRIQGSSGKHRLGHAVGEFRHARHVASAKPVGRGAPRGKPSKKKAANQPKGDDAPNAQHEMMLKVLSQKKDEQAGAPPDTASSDEDPDFVTVTKGTGKRKRAFKQVQGTIYNNPMYYDWAFSMREYEAEVDFMFDVYEELTGSEPKTFVELGCGPAQHSLEMAESGLHTYCIDNNENMLKYAASLAKEDDLNITCLNQDMREFKLPDNERADLIGIMLGTFQHMFTNDDAIRCMQASARNLNEGGLLILELAHPALLFDGSVVTSGDTWNIDLDTAQVEVFWGHEGDKFDSITQVLEKTVSIKIMMRGGDLLMLDEVVPMRQYTYQELSLIAKCAGLSVKGAYGDFNMASGIERSIASDVDESDEPRKRKYGDDGDMDDYDNDEPHRILLVLQKDSTV